MAYDFLDERRQLANLAAQQFTNTIRVVRHDGPPATGPDGVVTRPETLVYEGPGKITGTQIAGAERDELAGRFPRVESPRIDLPMGSPARAGDVAVILSSATNPHLVGLRLNLLQLERGERRTADRWRAEVATR